MANPKRVLNRWAVVALSVLLIIVASIYKLPRYSKEQSLEKLGYKEEEIKKIFSANVEKEVIAKGWYSLSLVEALDDEDFDRSHLGLYAVRNKVTADTISLYDELARKKGYSEEELLKMFKELQDYALIPLFVFEKVDADAYIADNAAHTENSAAAFVLTEDWLHPYENVRTVSDPAAIDVFVSKKDELGQYVPEKMVDIPQRYGVTNLQLQSAALAAFEDLCDALASELDEGIYAVGAYTSYEDQQALYETYGLDADLYTDRPGFCDEQTGLSVSVVSSADVSVSRFVDTASYTWMKEHAHEYGFIERYPQNKKSITGEEGAPYYWRYVGTDLAEALVKSGLTFDEYYCRYLLENAE